MDLNIFDVTNERVRVRVGVRSLAVLAAVLLTGILVSMGIEQFGVQLPIVRPVLAVLFLTFVPGGYAYLAIGAPDRSIPTTVSYIYGLSLVVVMLVGGVASIAFPVVGIDRPLSVPVLLGTAAVLIGLATVRLDASTSVTVRWDDILAPVPLALLLMPLLSVLGSALYATGGSNVLLLVLLGTVAMIPVMTATARSDDQYLPLAVWSISVSLLYHGRLFGFFTITQPLPNLTMRLGRWVPNYDVGVGSLLANGVLYPTYAIFTGLPMAVEWNLVNPFIVSLLPVVLFEAYRRYISPTGAFLSACIFMFSYSYYVLYPTGGRASTPVIFLALVALATSDTALDSRTQNVLAILFGAGVAVTHYGTAYVVLFALVVSTVTYIVLSWLVRVNIPALLEYRVGRENVKPALERAADRQLQLERPIILRYPYVGMYLTLSLGWYLYTGLGGKFSPLPKKVVDGVQGVLYGQTSGSTVTSFQQSYSAISITVAKYMYVIFGLFMAFGIAYAVFNLVLDREEVVPAGQLALGIGFLSMFLGSALPSGNAFAVARVMMIIFTFSVPFVVVGFDALPPLLGKLRPTLELHRSATALRIGLALFIALFFALNSGLMAETVTKGYAPSNQASEQRLAESDIPALRLRVRDCVSCDVDTHVWLGDNVPLDSAVYGDVTLDNQLDFYSGTISNQVDRTPPYQEVNSSMSDIPRGTYIGLLAHNRDLQGFAIGYKFNFYETNLEPYTDGDILYSNSHSLVTRRQNLTNHTN